MYNDVKFALAQLRHPFVLFALAFSFWVTVMLFGLASKLTYGAIASSDLSSHAWLTTLAGFVGGGFVVVLGYFLFPLTMSAIACLFLEPIASRIERRHFPDLPEGKPADWGDGLVLTFKMLARMTVYNLLVLPFYFIPVLNIFAFLAVNALLLGQEYYYALALRRLSLPQAETLYQNNKGELRKTGLQLAVLFLIPVLNVVAPILATAIMLNRLEKAPDGLLRRSLVKTP